MMFFFWGGVIFPSFIFGYFCWLPTRARVILTAHQGPTPVRGAPLRRWPEENNTTRRSASRSSNLGVVRRSRSCHPPRSAMGWYHGRKKHIRGGVLRAIPTWKTCIYIYIHDQNSYCIYIYNDANIYVFVGLFFWRSFPVQLEGCIKLSVHAAADYAPESHSVYIYN